MRISVDGSRIRNNKVAFSNLSGIVWTGPKLPYYFVKKLPLIFLLVKYFKFSPQCSGSISGPPFSV